MQVWPEEGRIEDLEVGDCEKYDGYHEDYNICNPVYDPNTNTLTYTVIAENATSMDLPGQFEKSVLVIDSKYGGVLGGYDIGGGPVYCCRQSSIIVLVRNKKSVRLGSLSRYVADRPKMGRSN